MREKNVIGNTSTVLYAQSKRNAFASCSVSAENDISLGLKLSLKRFLQGKLACAVEFQIKRGQKKKKPRKI